MSISGKRWGIWRCVGGDIDGGIRKFDNTGNWIMQILNENCGYLRHSAGTDGRLAAGWAGA